MLQHTITAPLNPTRVVILGAQGFVGKAATSILKRHGVPMLAFGRNDLDLLSGDAADRLAKLLRSTDSLLVISARAPVKNAEMLLENIRMMAPVCKALTSSPVRHVVYISSDAVYKDSKTPLTEASCAEPESLHGAMREVSERFEQFRREPLLIGSIDTATNRPPNSYAMAHRHSNCTN